MLNFPRWKVVTIAFVVLMGIITALPNFLNDQQRAAMPDFMPSDTLALGLDLQGGVYLLFEAKTEDIITSRLTNLADQVRDVSREEGRRRDIPRDQRITFTGVKVEGNSVVFDLRNEALFEEARQVLLPITQTQVGANSFGAGGATEMELSREGSKFRLALTEQGILVQQRDAITRSMEVIRRRVDPDGVKEIALKPSGDNRIILEVPGADDPEVLIDLIGRTAKLSFHDVNTDISYDDIRAGRYNKARFEEMTLKRGGTIVVNKREILSGDDLTDARPSFDDKGQPAVAFAFNTAGAKRFADHTRKNIGRPFAIRLDDIVISAPNIQVPILGGSGQITNMGTVADSSELATLLKSGALPVKLTVETQKTVGPDMGADGVAAGKLASIVGFIGVVIYMVLSYGRFGLAANVALITNLVLIMGALSLFQATLTLPGIAGIVLTIGMAVDANVLVFERIREEQNNGRKPFQAMEHGYGQAFSTIMDANITTFIAAAVLYMLGSGPVQGFAVTLAIGILTSMFTAIMLTRFILSSWVTRARPKKLPI
jgi:preprotein translocase subunit SecD